ncbi:dnaJ homolog subfamily C member 7 isoform X1 [Topomyia yanbarensis]|uniref:dnaJ homolog subfamily C member 7 isoform X1 n=1 Tax=Topomyia yanbarensis TaxID=2498891 RepID=UPI00273CADC6|nr:dnaJ homolog subfamily C member 7 isoform X1 [Topomyia yanbarensis]
MSAEQIIDLVSDENDDVIVIDDSPKRSFSEDSLTEGNQQYPDQAPFEADDHSPVDMDIEDIIPINNQTLAEEKKNAGNEQYKIKRYDAALNLYTEAINLCPGSPAYYGNRAATYMMLGDYKSALRDAKQSVALDAKFEKGYIRITKCCLLLGDLVGTEQAIKKFLELDPANQSLKQELQSLKQLRDLNEKAASCYDRQDYRTCLYHCDNAIKIAPGSIHYKLLKAECLAMLERFDEAGDIAISIMHSNSTNADAIYVRGLTLYYSDNLEKGLLHFERALQLDPDHKKAKLMRIKAKQLKERKERGNEMFKAGKFREALAVYTEALTLDPMNKDINSKLYYNRALVNSKLSNSQDAITDCTCALQLNEKYMKALLQRAKLHYGMENFEECVKDYEKALKFEKTIEIKNLLKDAKLQLKKSKRKDYYKILGVSKQASEDEIKKAYRKRALVHHPDRHANSSDDEKKEQERKFKEVGEAYTVLSDPVKKSRYDNGYDIEDLDQSDVDPQQMFRQFFQFQGGDAGFGGFGGGGSNFTFRFG